MWNLEVEPDSALGLGIDAGGTQTRWALADAGRRHRRRRPGAGLSALQMGSAAGRQTVHANFAMLAREVLRARPPAAGCAPA